LALTLGVGAGFVTDISDPKVIGGISTALFQPNYHENRGNRQESPVFSAILLAFRSIYLTKVVIAHLKRLENRGMRDNARQVDR
jgi:hypothetical protein